MKPHGRSCVEDACDFCQKLAEDTKAYDWPDYDTDAAADQYERSLGL